MSPAKNYIFYRDTGQVSEPDESGNTDTNNDKLPEQQNFQDRWKQMFIEIKQKPEITPEGKLILFITLYFIGQLI
jgi:hypothetical protein